MAMAKDPEHRFQSAQAFNAALKAVGTGASGVGATQTHTLILPPPLPASSSAAVGCFRL